MKLAYVDLCGFRGYRKQLRIDFPDGFTVIDGRNGAGKSTIFDAVEFALTGTISKYRDAKADRETVADYIWWRGEGRVPSDSYVEVGFRAGDEIFSVRRTQLMQKHDCSQALATVQDLLCDSRTSPKLPLPQLCMATIIRDEHIATLSLDLKETERYSLLRDAIGATDTDVWTERSSRLISLAEKRMQAAKNEVELAARDVALATRRIEEIRATLVEEEALAAATARLQLFSGSTSSLDQLIGPARAAIADKARQLEELAALEKAWQEVDEARSQLPALQRSVLVAQEARISAEAVYEAIKAKAQPVANSEVLSRHAHDIANLVALGRKLGLTDERCPLCSSAQTIFDFERGLALAESYARQLDAQSVELAEFEQSIAAAAANVASAQSQLGQCEVLLLQSQSLVERSNRRMAAAGLAEDSSLDRLRDVQESLRYGLRIAREDLRIIETLRLNAGLEKASQKESEARKFYARAEKRFGLARRTDSRVKALHNAVRRAAGETLDRRLEQVLPLMTELYSRLRPHPIWGDIEYKVRGDVKRFLKLQVGDELNPQFMFSSGQRRVTGLAFLLSVNLSLAWSRWRSILLDDPVQHVDDYRSVNLAEVMAQLAATGRQIICAVEDAALADLLCRRLPVEGLKNSKRVTLGADSEGALIALMEQDLVPLLPHALVIEQQRLAG